MKSLTKTEHFLMSEGWRQVSPPMLKEKASSKKKILQERFPEAEVRLVRTSIRKWGSRTPYEGYDPRRQQKYEQRFGGQIKYGTGIYVVYLRLPKWATDATPRTQLKEDDGWKL